MPQRTLAENKADEPDGEDKAAQRDGRSEEGPEERSPEVVARIEEPRPKHWSNNSSDLGRGGDDAARNYRHLEGNGGSWLRSEGASRAAVVIQRRFAKTKKFLLEGTGGAQLCEFGRPGSAVFPLVGDEQEEARPFEAAAVGNETIEVLQALLVRIGRQRVEVVKEAPKRLVVGRG